MEVMGDGDNGREQLQDTTPLDLDVMLDKKGVTNLYDDFIRSIVTTPDILITGDLVETKDIMLGRKKFDMQKIVRILQGKSLEEEDEEEEAEENASGINQKEEDTAFNFQQAFLEKGVNVLVCKLTVADRLAVYRWLEFVDLEVAGEEYRSVNDLTLVGGRRLLPKGVVVMDLGYVTQAKQKLANFETACTKELQQLLGSKESTTIYKAFVQAIVDSKKTVTSMTGQFIMPEIWTILQDFEKDFEAKNIRVVVCEEYTDLLNPKWLEFIDMEIAPGDYHSPYDIRHVPKESTQVNRYLHEGVAEVILVEEGKIQRVVATDAECPEQVRKLLDAKDLIPAYQTLVKAIADAGKSITSVDSIVPILTASEGVFLNKGIQVVVCTGTFNGTFSQVTRIWLEFIDTALAHHYVANYDASNTNKIANGQYMPPEGVALKELVVGNKKKLVDECPKVLDSLLKRKGLAILAEYQELIRSISDSANTKSALTGKWVTAGLISVVDEFEERFAAKGLKLVLCKNKWYGKSYHWLEFIDTAVALGGNYVAPFNAKLLKKILNGKHVVPNDGVEILELLGVDGLASLRGACPADLDQLLERKGAKEWYQELVRALILKLPSEATLTENLADVAIGAVVKKETVKAVNDKLQVVPEGLIPKTIEERWEYAYPR